MHFVHRVLGQFLYDFVDIVFYLNTHYFILIFVQEPYTLKTLPQLHLINILNTTEKSILYYSKTVILSKGVKWSHWRNRKYFCKYNYAYELNLFNHDYQYKKETSFIHVKFFNWWSIIKSETFVHFLRIYLKSAHLSSLHVFYMLNAMILLHNLHPMPFCIPQNWICSLIRI